MPSSYEEHWGWSKDSADELAVDNEEAANLIVHFAPHFQSDVEGLFFDDSIDDIDRRNELEDIIEKMLDEGIADIFDDEAVRVEPSLPDFERVDGTVTQSPDLALPEKQKKVAQFWLRLYFRLKDSDANAWVTPFRPFRPWNS